MNEIESLCPSKLACRRSFRPEQARSNLPHDRRRAQALEGAKFGATFQWQSLYRRAVVGAVFALVSSGCASVNNPFLSSGPHPRVEDCALVQQATPTRYVCDGKIYTSVQLDDISRGKQVQLSEQASRGAFPGNVITPTGNFGTYPQGGAASPGRGVH
jgi:hypothetical protein